MAKGKMTVPTDEERKRVQAMSGYGVPHQQIASLVCGGIDRDTLCKHFRIELDTGKAKANAKVGQTLFQRATEDGDTAALIFWAKTQMGWKEKKEVHVVDVTNNVIKVPVSSESDWEEMAEKSQEELIKQNG